MNQLHHPFKELFEDQLHILTQNLDNTTWVNDQCSTEAKTERLAEEIFKFTDEYRCVLDSVNVKNIKDSLQKVISNVQSTNAAITKLIQQIDELYNIVREESKKKFEESLKNINNRLSKIEIDKPGSTAKEREILDNMYFMLKIGRKVTKQQIAETS